jgi:7-cyano-7-deazaguanine reductase
MTKLGTTSSEVLREIEARASKDLSELVEAEVKVFIYSNREALELDFEVASELWNIDTSETISHNAYVTLEDTFVSVKDEFDTYTETPELLQILDSRGDLPPNDMFNSADFQTYNYHSAVLRSRCRVTSQPDTGDVFISYVGSKTVTPLSLLKYIVSFRDECHFHEEICEAIYKRLWDVLQPESLSVKCLYARRGSWDINPERVSNEKLKHKELGDAEFLHIKLPRQ